LNHRHPVAGRHAERAQPAPIARPRRSARRSEASAPRRRWRAGRQRGRRCHRAFVAAGRNLQLSPAGEGRSACECAGFRSLSVKVACAVSRGNTKPRARPGVGPCRQSPGLRGVTFHEQPHLFALVVKFKRVFRRPAWGVFVRGLDRTCAVPRGLPVVSVVGL
jgi:hypothetical protein